ncbi:MAG: ABC transporter ATP-binding protein [Gemmatimonadota bacterium]
MSAQPAAREPAEVKRADAEALLRVTDLRAYLDTEEGETRAVDGVSLAVWPGETLGLVGESGSGKSLTALAIVGLLPRPRGRIAGGSIRLRGEELLRASRSRMREVRGGEIGMVFQEPMTSLNPVLRIGDQVGETIREHHGTRGDALDRAVIELLERVGIPDPERRRRAYPHELSGGMRQRVMIAMAISCRPALLIADEPTTALDVTIQKQILELLSSLQRETGMALLLITHDLGVVGEVADRVVVMYAGQIVERGPVSGLFDRPLHPYTEGLLAAVPDPDVRRLPLPVIPGGVPHPARWPSGCRFHPRCPHAWPRCAAEPPPMREARRTARCWLVEEPDRRLPVPRVPGGVRAR